MVVAPEEAIRTSFFKSSVKTCHFTDETVHFCGFVRKTIGFHGQTCLVKDDQVHFYRKTALGTLFFQGNKSRFAMFMHLVY